jgi:hypothetical protein
LLLFTTTYFPFSTILAAQREGADSHATNEAGDIEMNNSSDTPDNGKEPSRALREWQAPVLIKETTDITQSGKASNFTEVNGPPNFGPAS